jgi:hypothetical protein
MGAKKSKVKSKAKPRVVAEKKRQSAAGRTPPEKESETNGGDQVQGKDERTPDAAQVRENLKRQVRGSAEKIADGLISVAEAGQLAPAKYLFEVAGLYPATEETGPRENSLAYVLLKRLGLPTEPMTREKEEEQRLNAEVAEKGPETRRDGGDGVRQGFLEGRQPAKLDAVE